VATPHISAAPGDFSDVCLLPGDPLRARYVAKQFLDDARQITAVRNMDGYTGTYDGRRVSVMGTGMGVPSALIYATELIRQYDVTTLIRIGSCGGIDPGLSVGDLVIASGASTDSNVNRLRFGGYDFAAIADFELTRSLVDVARQRNLAVRVGNVLTSDQFYHPQPEIFELCKHMGILAAEMESAGLFAIAAEHGVRAASILTVSDVLGSKEEMSSEAREKSLDDMIGVALEVVRAIE
jgi:purine-nucleoside phosphorylase